MFYNKSASKIWLLGFASLIIWFLLESGFANIINGYNLFQGSLFLVFALIIAGLAFSGIVEKSIRKFLYSIKRSTTKIFLIIISVVILMIGINQVILILIWPTSNIIRGGLFWLRELDAYITFFLSVIWLGYNIYFIRLER